MRGWGPRRRRGGLRTPPRAGESPSVTILRPAIVFRRAPTLYVGTEGHVLMADVLGASPRAESGLVRRERLLVPIICLSAAGSPDVIKAKVGGKAQPPNCAWGSLRTGRNSSQHHFPVLSPPQGHRALRMSSSPSDQTRPLRRINSSSSKLLSPRQVHPTLLYPPGRDGHPGVHPGSRQGWKKAVLGNTKASYKPTFGWDLYSFREYERCTH